jgi:hypothetical protein
MLVSVLSLTTVDAQVQPSYNLDASVLRGARERQVEAGWPAK